MWANLGLNARMHTRTHERRDKSTLCWERKNGPKLLLKTPPTLLVNRWRSEQG